MEIVNFFEKLAGRWFSQRTTHALSTQQSKAGKSDLEVEFLAPDSPDVMAFCQAIPNTVLGSPTPLCGLRIQQNSTIEGDTQPQQLTHLMVPMTPSHPAAAASGEDAGQLSSGRLLSSGASGGVVAQGVYTLEDEVLTITTETEAANSTERLWFINDNLRMRTGMTELASGLRIASFCSEIRMGGKPPK